MHMFALRHRVSMNTAGTEAGARASEISQAASDANRETRRNPGAVHAEPQMVGGFLKPMVPATGVNCELFDVVNWSWSWY